MVELFRQFTGIAAYNKFPASWRVVYYIVLHLWYNAHQPETLRTESYILHELSGLSVSATNSALAELSNRGFVSFTRRGGSLWLHVKPFEKWQVAGKPLVAKYRVHVSRNETGTGAKPLPAVEVLNTSPNVPVCNDTRVDIAEVDAILAQIIE